MQRLRGIFGRHIATIQLIEDILPALCGEVVRNLPTYIVEAHLALLLPGPMTIDTVFLEERLQPFPGVGQSRTVPATIDRCHLLVRSQSKCGKNETHEGKRQKNSSHFQNVPRVKDQLSNSGTTPVL